VAVAATDKTANVLVPAKALAATTAREVDR
jgi:hypothetical protein